MLIPCPPTPLQQNKTVWVGLKTHPMLFTAGWKGAVKPRGSFYQQQWLQDLSEWKPLDKAGTQPNTVPEVYLLLAGPQRQVENRVDDHVYILKNSFWGVGDGNKKFIFLFNLSPILPSKWFWLKETICAHKTPAILPSGKREVLDPEILSKLTDTWPRHLRAIVPLVASISHLPTMIPRYVSFPL